jgi:phage gpG-like protein
MFEFKPWRKFYSQLQRPVIRGWLSAVRARAQQHFAAGMLGRHSGRIYRRRGGRRHQASAPGEYPANDTGRLLASLKSRQAKDSVTIGTNVHYAKFLREGTRKMARRKMSDHALVAGAEQAKPRSRGWVQWARGNHARKSRSLN